MLLTPRYDGVPAMTIDGPAGDQRDPLLRQRRRMESLLGALTDEQWSHPTRCDGWTVQDVVAHLVGTNQFWQASIASGLAGQPTRVLARFDPAATPPLMVEPMRSMTSQEVLEEFVDSNRGFFDVVGMLDDATWSMLAEAPPGHIPIRLVVNHAMWDAWIHERDIALPLGITTDEEPDEVRSCLRYVAALAPTLAQSREPALRGSLVIDATDPECRYVVEAGATVTVHSGTAPSGSVQLRGRAVDLVEALSIRAPIDQPVAEEGRWLLGGLADAFDRSPA